MNACSTLELNAIGKWNVLGVLRFGEHRTPAQYNSLKALYVDLAGIGFDAVAGVLRSQQEARAEE